MFGDTFVSNGGSGFILGATGLVSPAGLPTVPALATNYAIPFLNGLFTIAPSFPVPIGGIINNLYLRLNAPTPAGGTFVCSFMVNAVAVITITVPALDAAQTYTELITNVPVVAGDLIRWNYTNNAPVASPTPTATMVLFTP